MPEDGKTIFLNNDDANQVFRICTMHGVDPEIANKIAIDVGKVEARSRRGQISEVTWEWFKKWWVTLLSAVGAVILGWIAWALEFIKFGGGAS